MGKYSSYWHPLPPVDGPGPPGVEEEGFQAGFEVGVPPGVEEEEGYGFEAGFEVGVAPGVEEEEEEDGLQAGYEELGLGVVPDGLVFVLLEPRLSNGSVSKEAPIWR